MNKIPVKHVKDLIHNLEDVKKLVQIHIELTGTKRGSNRSRVNVLNKSGIVLVVACWEAYIEDLAEAAFEYLLTNAKNPNIFDKKVLVLASKTLRESKDETVVWSLAGDGWRQVLLDHKSFILKKHLGKFNTAKSTPINELFADLIGFNLKGNSNVSKYWTWKGMSSNRACARLDNLVTLRGDIAHRVQAQRTVTKSEVEEAVDFVQYLAAITSNALGIYLRTRTRVAPWPLVSYADRK